MAQYRNFERQLKKFPTGYYGSDSKAKEENQKAFINNLKLGQVFIHYSWVRWDKFKEKFKNEGVIIDRYEFKQKRMARDYKNCAAIVLQIGEEVYDFKDLKEEQKFDTNSLMI